MRSQLKGFTARRCGHSLCLTGILFALLCALSPAQAKFSTVVIDPGHGGSDAGGIPGQFGVEKSLALDVAFRLERNLRDAGLRTVMTRASDVAVTLPRRVAIGNAQRNAVFVSIHFNSSTRMGAAGIETYYYAPGSRTLAAGIQRRLCGAIAIENRGVKQRSLHVLRCSRCPAVLVECGFLTNPGEAALARQARHREKLAREIAIAVMDQRNWYSGRDLQATR